MPKYFGGGGGGSGGAVSSVFGRTGAVVAVAGDYDSDEVINVSSNPGASVSNALEACVLINGSRPLAGNWSLGDNSLINAKTITYFAENDNGNSGAAAVISWADGQAQKIVLTDNSILSFVAPPGVCSLTLKIVQDAVGNKTVSWPGSVLWPGGFPPVLSTAANAVDIVSFYYDGANYYGSSNTSSVDNASITLNGSGQVQRAALTGDVTAAAGSNVTAIAAGVIVNNQVNAAAAIAGTKISPNFGAQDITTTGILNLGAVLPTVGEIRIANGFRLNSITTALVNVNVVQFTAGNSAVFGSSLAGSILNGSTTSVRVNNSDVLVCSTGVAGLSVALLRFDSSITAPNVFQQTNAANSATGEALTVHAQDCSGTTSTGGILNLRPGSGTTAGGELRIQTGGATNRIRVNDTGIGFFAVAPVARQDITGSRGGNAALADLLTKLALTGLITDSTAA